MNNWQAVGYIFVGFGMVLFIFAILAGYFVASPFREILPQLAQATFIAFITPWIVLACLSFVVGFVGLFVGRNRMDSKVTAKNTLLGEPNLLERINRLEAVVDNNFAVIAKRFDEIEEQQKLVSKSTLIKAKKE